MPRKHSKWGGPIRAFFVPLVWNLDDITALSPIGKVPIIVEAQWVNPAFLKNLIKM